MEKILVVVTNNDRMGASGKQTGWYLPEVAHPHHVFVKNGFTVDYMSPKGGNAPVDEGSVKNFATDSICTDFLNDPKLKKELEQTKSPSQINPNDYRAIFYAGGHGPMWDLPEDERVAAIATKIYENSGVVGAVCHGPVGLLPIKLSNGNYLVKGKKVACFTNEEEELIQLTKVVPFSLEDKLKERGANWVFGEKWEAHVEVDSRVVTGQNPSSATPVAEAIVQLLKGI